MLIILSKITRKFKHHILTIKKKRKSAVVFIFLESSIFFKEKNLSLKY